MSSVEFKCEGCGISVVAFGIRKPPKHGFCGVCQWVSEFVPPEEIMQVLRRIDHMTMAIGDSDDPGHHPARAETAT